MSQIHLSDGRVIIGTITQIVEDDGVISTPVRNMPTPPVLAPASTPAVPVVGARVRIIKVCSWDDDLRNGAEGPLLEIDSTDHDATYRVRTGPGRHYTWATSVEPV